MIANYPRQPPRSTSTAFDCEQINAQLPRYLEQLGCELKRQGQGYKTLCPLHQESHASFHLDQRQGQWLAHCYGSGCHWGGDLIALHAALTGRDPQRDFAALAAELSARFGIPSLTGHSLPQDPRSQGLPRAISSPQPQMIEPEERELRERADLALPAILKAYDLPDWRAELWDQSPLRLEGPAEEDWRLLITHAFSPDDRLWIGEPYDSGRPVHERHFRPAREHLAERQPLGWRMALATFVEGSYRRSQATMAEARYCLLECDALIGRKPQTAAEKEQNKRHSAALYFWLMEELGLEIRAIIDTGNRSLHAWARPSIAMHQELQKMAPGLGLDDILTTGHAPVRLPGCPHQVTGRRASLLYLNPGSE